MTLALTLYAAFLLTMYVAAAFLIFFIRGQSAIPTVLGSYAAIAAMVGWVAVRPPRARTVVAAALGASVAVAVLADAWPAVVVAGVMALAAYGVGAAAVGGILGDRIRGGPERLAYELAIGVALLAYATLALGLAGHLDRAAIGLLYALVLAATGRRTLAALRRAAGDPSRRASVSRANVLLLLGAVWAVLLFVEAIGPELQYDSLSYHLGLPRVWIDAGRIVEVPEQPQSYLYELTEMSYAGAMLFGGQIAAKLVSLGLFAVGCLGLYGWTRAVADGRSAAVATLAYVATPVVAWEATTTSIDATLATYVLLAVVAGYRAAAASDARWATLAGALAGAAIGTKVTAVTALAPLAALLFAMTLTRGARARWIAPVFCAAATVAALPWPALRYVQTGNPIFPFFNNVFRSPLWPPVAPNLDEFGIGRDPLALLRLPFAVSFDAQTFAEAFRGPVLGLGLLALPLALPAMRRRPEFRFLGIFSIAAFVGWALSAQQLRYLVPVLPVLAVLAAVGLRDLATAVAGPAARAAVVVVPAILALAGFPLYLGTLWNVPERVPLGVATGLESRGSYLSRTLPTYGALAALAAQPGSSGTRLVLLAKDGGRGDDEDRLYAPGQVETLSSPRAHDLFTSTDEAVALAWLRDRGVTHVLLNHDGLHGPLARAAVARDAFLARIGTLVYSEGPIALYELHLP